MQIGDIRVDALIDGEVAVPKDGLYPGVGEAEWEPYKSHLCCITGDQINTVGSFLIRHGDRLILHDAGGGPQSIFPFTSGGLRSSLTLNGVAPTDITDVIYSHLHVDHYGWTSVNGKSFFPNATLHIDKREWDFYSNPDRPLDEWEAPVINTETDTVAKRFAPALSQIQLFEGDAELMPGILAHDAAGHTPGSTVIEITSNGESGLLIGDLVHTQPEMVRDDWDFPVNRDPELARKAIDRFRKRIYDDNLPFAAAHFPGMAWGRLTKGQGSELVYEKID